MRASFTALVVSVLACGIGFGTGCGNAAPEDEVPLSHVCGAVEHTMRQRPPKSDRELPTTSGEEFLAGFDGQLAAARAAVTNDATSPTKRRTYAGLLVAHGKHHLDLEEIQGGIDELGAALALDPQDPSPHVERANALQSLHRFPQARAELSRARALGGDEQAIVAIEQELDWNDGRYDRAIAAIRAAVARDRTMWTVAREARLMHDLGDVAAADRLFAEAEDLVVDTSPIPVAWLDFQRGLHAMELGRLDEAILFFRAAVARIPTWIPAQEHLAECLHLVSSTDEAIAIYVDVVARSKDPEHAGALASVYRKLGRVAEANVLRDRARAGYDALIANFPEAMYAHASEFFLGEGNDPSRAFSLRAANLTLRPNAVARAWLAESLLLRGDLEAARTAIDAALATPIRDATILWTAARVYARRDRARATMLAGDACALNPRISSDEPAL